MLVLFQWAGRRFCGGAEDKWEKRFVGVLNFRYKNQTSSAQAIDIGISTFIIGGACKSYRNGAWIRARRKRTCQ